MSKFKVGDKVRYLGSTYRDHKRNYTVGQTLTINSNDNSLCLPYTVKEGHGCFDDNHFELVTEAESELERLVRVANEGFAAIQELAEKYPTDVIDEDGDSPTDFVKYTFTIKPKPKFEPFTVGSGWQVKLEGETLHIGCQTFPAKALKRGLETLCRQGGAMTDSGSGKIQAMRDSVEHASGNRISWADADKILAALEKAGIK